MNPQQRYDQDLQNKLIIADEAQLRVVSSLQALFDGLLSREQESRSLISRLQRWRRGWADSGESRAVIQGLYLWGGVGRGKTYLMDLFYDCLPLEKKQRTHFHRFMQRVHRDLGRLQGEKNPLERVADKIADEAKVLCFDEFFVQDIADAMILAGLLDALMRRQVVLVATSNIAPDRLYENGLQRDRFLPSIELIKRHTQLIEIQTGVDYRLRSLSQATLYHCPIVETTEQRLLSCFRDLTPDKTEIREGGFIELLERKLQTRYCADDVVWFEFEHLCEGPRSAFDYVELAKMYHAVLLSAVPQLDETRNDSARRFISLVDELYDRRVKLIIAADAPIQTLYQGQQLGFEFERTRSRLWEMQSQEYLGYQHRA
jgi:cell division protein ZapE